jgi:uncharacterized membrane protein
MSGHPVEPATTSVGLADIGAIEMGSTTVRAITIACAAVGSGLVGGVLFAFSSFVMPALRRVPPANGIAAMQSINRQAVTPAFGSLLAGTFVLSIGGAVYAAFHRDDPATRWVAVGTLAYVGAMVVTVAYNVPRNDRLATFDATTADAARYWATYLSQWTAANHVRTALCAMSSAAFTMAFRATR